MTTNLKDDRWCFACGTENPHGLHLQDIHLENQDCVCTFEPARWHQGWAEIVHGGITATLLDEVMTHALWRRGHDAVTAEMTVRLKQPISVGETLTARARITRLRGRFAEVEAEVLLADGTAAAGATGKFFTTRRGPDTPGNKPSLAARDAVIFDLFGTLVPVFTHDEYFAVLGEMARALGMAEEAFIPAFRRDAFARTSGKWARLEDNIADLARRAGLSVTDDQIAQAAQVRYDYTRQQLLSPHPDALAALQSLRAAGRPIGLISDCSPETPIVWPESPLAEYIPAPVFSCAVGLKKPDPRIYHLACERMGIDPYSGVYVGDGDSDELRGAAAVGLCPILIDRNEASAFRTSQCKDCEIIVHDLTQVLGLLGIEAEA